MSQKSHVCGAESGACHLRAGLAAEVVVQGSSLPASYMNAPQTSFSRLVKPSRAWLTVTVSTKSDSKV